MKTLKSLFSVVFDFYDNLPQTVKVSGWVIVSYLLSQLVMELSGYETDNAFAMAVANIALVFLRESKKQVDERKK